jgi:ankyrin repeat protein
VQRLKYFTDIVYAEIVFVEDETNLLLALHYACYNGHLPIVKLLLEKGARTDVKDSYLHKTALEFAMYKQFGDIVALMDPSKIL